MPTTTMTEHTRADKATGPGTYAQLEALLAGKNQEMINHGAALQLTEKFPTDPIMLAYKAWLLHPTRTGYSLTDCKCNEAESLQTWNYAIELGLLECANKFEPFANNIVGMSYLEGIGNGIDLGMAATWFRRAAKCGLSIGQSNYGFMIEKGLGVDRADCLVAAKWYHMAALQGNIYAQFFLASLYKKERGNVPQNLEVAAEWFQKAANQGHEESQFNLGQLYQDGNGVVQNDRTAFEWYRKAASQDYLEALYSVGVFYDEGRGVAPSVIRAIEWHQKAAERGHEPSKKRIKVLFKVLDLNLADHAGSA